MSTSARILIVSSCIDAHAFAVRWALERLGHNVHFWDIADFPAKREMSVFYNEDMGVGLTSLGDSGDLKGPYDTVWLRRKSAPTPRPDTHEDDVRIVNRESERFIANVLPNLGHRDTLWVNHPDVEARADLKLNQLSAAKEVGFAIPPTYMGNSPVAVREFYARYEGNIVFKAFRSAGWSNFDGTKTVLRTSRLDPAHVTNDFAISACPGIYQALVSKRYEVRVTVFGPHIYAVKVDSQRQGETIDWRYDFPPGQEPLAPMDLPEDIARRCLLLCRHFSLTYAAFDFIVDKEGKYIFLELNQAGQFLFAENHVPTVTLLDSFARFLARKDLSAAESKVHLRDCFESPQWRDFLKLDHALRAAAAATANVG